MSDTTKSVADELDTILRCLDSNPAIQRDVKQRVTQLIQEAYKKGYIDGGIATLTQDTKGGTEQ